MIYIVLQEMVKTFYITNLKILTNYQNSSVHFFTLKYRESYVIDKKINVHFVEIFILT